MIQKTVLKVSGMSCAACSARIEKALSPIKGIESVEAVFSSNMVSVTYDDDVVKPERIKEVLAKAGYPVLEKDRLDNSWNPVYIIVSGILTVILFIYAMGPMFGLNVPFTDSPVIYSVIQFILATPVVILGRKFFVKGIPALLHKSPTMDTLVSLGSGTAYLYSCYITVCILLGMKDSVSGICFDSAAMIITLISVGKYMEFRSRVKADDAVDKLLTLIPDETNVIRDGIEITIKTDDLAIGDVVIVRPGERISADGIVIEGRTSVNESMLTGESVPIVKDVGSQVFTGTVNADGSVKFRVTGIGGDTVISEIVKLLEDAKATKAPVARMADRVASVFVPTVIAIAVVSGLLWFISGKTVGFALNVMISVLVISCPCALGLATPMAVTVGSGKAAEHGILFRNAAALEMCGRIDSVILDKTGTVTEGVPKVESYIGDVSVLSAVMAAESKSEHPIGKAIVRYCEENGITPAEIYDFEYTVGKGIRFVSDGRTVTAGSPDLYDGDGIEEEGFTTVFISSDSQPVGKFVLSDGIRNEAIDAVSILHERGIQVSMVSGDNESSVKRVADICNISQYTAGALPQDKVTAVKRLQAKGHDVMMVGDGVNDSPALAQADAGVAMGSGSDIALGSSDVVILNDDILSIPRAVDYGRKTLGNVKQNLFLAFCYNVVCIPIAAGLPYLFGIAEFSHMPMIAAAAMSLSSLSVVSNALRLRRFDPDY
ncbi:MAG: cadmium-translocating P-type ATPase [Thermoplasmata archaeon]|nr:cadmium-translocating P-type ATPase [Thermoplasmata archaeon]